MARLFNIGGPCIAAKHYMLPAPERLSDVMSLIRKEQCFVVHAPRQCGKTTAFRALMDEIDAKGDMAAALYAKSPEKAHEQILKHMDGLGQSEGWLVVADPDVSKPWDGKISTEDLTFGEKTVHIVRC